MLGDHGMVAHEALEDVGKQPGAAVIDPVARGAIARKLLPIRLDRFWRLRGSAADDGIASASAMYAAVYAFGPRWSLIGTDRSISLPNISEAEQVKSFRAIQSWIDENNPSPEAIAERIRATGVRELGSEAFN